VARMVSVDHWFLARWRALLGALAAAVVLLGILWGAVAIYRDHLIEDAHHELLASLQPQTHALAAAVDRRLSLLAALRAFASVNVAPDRLAAEFPTMAAELYGSVAGIRYLTLAPGGVQTYVHPLDGNETLVGHDLATDARAEVRDQAASATASRSVSVSGPHRWADGELGLMAHMAVEVDGATWGLATAAFDVPALLADAGLDSRSDGVRLALLDGTGRVFSGDPDVLREDPVTATIDVGDMAWTLAVVPESGWESAVAGTMSAIWVSGWLLVFVSAVQVYSLVHRERRIVDTAQELARSAAESHSRLLSSSKTDEGVWATILRNAGLDALRITLTFLAVGGLWVVLSNAILTSLAIEGRALRRAQSVKDWAFVVATCLLLFLVVRRRLVQTRRSAGLAAESERRYRLLAENTADIIWQMGVDGVLTYANPGSEDLLGYAPHELVGRPVHAIAEGDDLTLIEREIAGAFSTGVSGEIMTRLRRRDGSLVPVEIRANIVHDDRGEVVGLQGFVRDATERVAADREREQLLSRIREQVLLVERIINSVPDGVVVLDEACRPTMVNPAAESMLLRLGYRHDDPAPVLAQLGNRSLTEVLAPAPRGLWHEVSVGDEIYEVVARHLVDPRTPEDVIGGRWVLLLHDATADREARARLEEQARLSALGQMAAGIAHDFNNILAVVMLYTQMALRGSALEDVTRERLQVVLEQSERAGALVQQILDFGRRSAMALEPTDLASLLEEEAELLRRTLPETIQVTFAHQGGPCVARADRRRLQQAIMNLAVNARDAMPDGGRLQLEVATIGVSLGNPHPLLDLSPGRYSEISVSDTGAGIARDILPHVFEPFFTTKEERKGSGLGLAQVYGIVQQHGGQIAVSSDVGAGTRFVICLPAVRATSDVGQLAELDAAPRGRGDLVLLVEDHAATRVAVAESLELLNYRVITVNHGGEALAVMDRPDHGVAVVLSDFVMPQVNGRALFDALQSRNTSVPMLILTGHPMTAELEEMLATGLSGWLPKPPDLARLAELLAQAIGR